LTDAYNISVGKMKEEKQLGEIRRRREDRIKIGMIEIGCKSVEWIDLAEECTQ
jgi:hypothetical protein